MTKIIIIFCISCSCMILSMMLLYRYFIDDYETFASLPSCSDVTARPFESSSSSVVASGKSGTCQVNQYIPGGNYVPSSMWCSDGNFVNAGSDQVGFSETSIANEIRSLPPFVTSKPMNVAGRAGPCAVSGGTVTAAQKEIYQRKRAICNLHARNLPTSETNMVAVLSCYRDLEGLEEAEESSILATSCMNSCIGCVAPSSSTSPHDGANIGYNGCKNAYTEVIAWASNCVAVTEWYDEREAVQTTNAIDDTTGHYIAVMCANNGGLQIGCSFCTSCKTERNGTSTTPCAMVRCRTLPNVTVGKSAPALF